MFRLPHNPYAVKAVVATAGLGSHLLPASKEMPKEMFPVFDFEDGEMVVSLFCRLYLSNYTTRALGSLVLWWAGGSAP
jgi:hypothetical protein